MKWFINTFLPSIFDGETAKKYYITDRQAEVCRRYMTAKKGYRATTWYITWSDRDVVLCNAGKYWYLIFSQNSEEFGSYKKSQIQKKVSSIRNLPEKAKKRRYADFLKICNEIEAFEKEILIKNDPEEITCLKEDIQFLKNKPEYLAFTCARDEIII